MIKICENFYNYSLTIINSVWPNGMSNVEKNFKISIAYDYHTIGEAVFNS